MEVRLAKELLHIQHWLEVAASIVANGKAAYDTDEVAQEAGDSLMIKAGKAAKNREKFAHHYSVTDREVTSQTLSVSLPAWAAALAPLPSEAAAVLDAAHAAGANDVPQES